MIRSGKSSKPIDWQEVHERLDRSAAAQRDNAPMSDTEIRAILDVRARLLARIPRRPLDAAERIDVVTFTLAGERLALETRFVRRVLSRWEATVVPEAPEPLIGLINLQGDVVPLFDLRLLLGMPGEKCTEPALLLVLGVNEHEFGVLADAVEDVRLLPVADLLEPPSSVERLGRNAVRGVTEDALIVIDGEALLADERLFIHQSDEPAP